MSKSARDQEIEDLKTVMSTAGGRRFMFRLFSAAKIFDRCFTGNSTTYYNEGRRELGLEFFNDLATNCPSEFARAQQEFIKQQESSDGKPR